jgi:hypothetical protein
VATATAAKLSAHSMHAQANSIDRGSNHHYPALKSNRAGPVLNIQTRLFTLRSFVLLTNAVRGQIYANEK